MQNDWIRAAFLLPLSLNLNVSVCAFLKRVGYKPDDTRVGFFFVHVYRWHGYPTRHNRPHGARGLQRGGASVTAGRANPGGRESVGRAPQWGSVDAASEQPATGREAGKSRESRTGSRVTAFVSATMAGARESEGGCPPQGGKAGKQGGKRCRQRQPRAPQGAANTY